jgi:hypothetical protein
MSDLLTEIYLSIWDGPAAPSAVYCVEFPVQAARKIWGKWGKVGCESGENARNRPNFLLYIQIDTESFSVLNHTGFNY